MKQCFRKPVNAHAQHTLNEAVTFHGKGVHSDMPAVMTLHPAPANSGIFFVRTSEAGKTVKIPARYDAVGATELCTIIGDPKGTFVATIEHLMAALSALSVDNLKIEISGAEVPVMDGSSSEFVDAIREVGLLTQAARRKYIRIDRTIRVEMGDAYAELTPHDGCEFDVEIDFSDATIGRQRMATEMTPDTFYSDVCEARTFGFMADVEKLWKAGYALGSSLENSVVIGDGGVINDDGLRYSDEFVRHKMLDAVGDLALAGAPIRGRYRSYKGGHRLNFMMVKALYENRDAWSLVELTDEMPSLYAKSSGSVPSAEAAVLLAPSKV